MIKLFSFLLVAMVLVIFTGCGDNRIYEDYKEYNSKMWLASDTAVFDFQISDTKKKYNLKLNARVSIDYPVQRLFVTYLLFDSGNTNLSSKLVSGYLFDKSGKPLGKSGIGDIYDNQLPLLADYTFKKPGQYRMKFAQMTRTDIHPDTLTGFLAIGLRVEEVVPEKK